MVDYSRTDEKHFKHEVKLQKTTDQVHILHGLRRLHIHTHTTYQ
jgi:hypothetical protein